MPLTLDAKDLVVKTNSDDAFTTEEIETIKESIVKTFVEETNMNEAAKQIKKNFSERFGGSWLVII